MASKFPLGYYNYKTIKGDTFDSIALDFYNQENLASQIINANMDYRRVLIFNAGIKLKIPVIEEQTAASLPPWKRGE